MLIDSSCSSLLDSGSSAKNELLEWVRRQIPEYNIQNFTGDWQSGKAIMALANAVEPGVFDLGREMSDDAISNCSKTFDRCNSDMAIPKLIDPEDMVNEPDEKSNMTYISYFRDYVENAKKRKAKDELERIAIASKTRIYGHGVENDQEAFIATQFVIEAINQFDRRVPIGGTPFQVKVQTGGKDIPFTFVDNNDGTYQVGYEPRNAGTFVITVQLEARVCGNSPYRVTCHAAKIDPSKCEAYGPGLQSAKVGEKAVFYIKSSNSQGTPIPIGGTPFQVKVHCALGSVAPLITDNQNGTYDVVYEPIDPMDHTIEISLDGQSVAHSPYLVPVSCLEGRPSAIFSYAKGPGLEAGNTTSLPAEFSIFSLNEHGEPVPVPAKAFDVLIVDPLGAEIVPELTVSGDQVLVCYRPTEAGDYLVQSLLRHPLRPLFYDHIIGSPATVHIVAGSDSGQSFAFGPGLENGNPDNQPAHFTIQACDKHGQKIQKGGDPFEVSVIDPEGNKLSADIKDNGDGTYHVSYNPEGPGTYKVNTTLRSNHIKNSPATVHIKAGVERGFCCVEDYSFVIQARDKRNSHVKEGGGNFAVQITGPNGLVPEKDVVVQDLKDGTYLVKYKLVELGSFSIVVTLDGENIRGSPWQQVHQ